MKDKTFAKSEGQSQKMNAEKAGSGRIITPAGIGVEINASSRGFVTRKGGQFVTLRPPERPKQRSMTGCWTYAVI